MANTEKKKREPRKITFIEALLLLLLCIFVLIFNAFQLGMSTGMALLVDAILVLIYGIFVLGYKFEELFDGALDMCKRSMSVIYLLMACGVVQAGWLVSGTVPYIIYIGLKVLTPATFLVISFVVCFLCGVFSGNGWGMMTTVGLALVSVGTALGIPLYMSVGAIVGGCMTGDRWSPLVDTVNLCAATSGADTMKLWRSMILNTVIGFVASVVLYIILGIVYKTSGSTEQAQLFLDGLGQAYNFNILCLLPIVVIIVLMVLKVHPVVSFVVSGLSGVVVGCFTQGANLWEGLQACWSGYVSNTGIAEIDSLLSLGGLLYNQSLIMLILVAFVFAGALNKLEVLRVLMEGIISKMKKPGALVTACELTSLAGVFISTSVYVSVILNAEIYKSGFKKMKLDEEVHARAMCEGAAFASVYVPYSGGGALVTSTLLAGVWSFAWIPFCFAGWIPAVANIVLSLLGINLKKKSPEISEAVAE